MKDKVLKLETNGTWEDGWIVVNCADEAKEISGLYDGHDPQKLFGSLKDEKKRKPKRPPLSEGTLL